MNPLRGAFPALTVSLALSATMPLFGRRALLRATTGFLLIPAFDF